MTHVAVTQAVNDLMHIQVQHSGTAGMVIQYRLLGNNLCLRKGSFKGTEVQLRINNLAAGHYMLQVCIDNEEVNIPFEKRNG